MTSRWTIVAMACSVLYIVSSLLPIWTADYWWVRIWDFPRVQIAVLGAASFGFILLTRMRRWLKALFVPALCTAIGFDVYRIFPYTPFATLDVLKAERQDARQQLSILEANVLQTNTKYEAMMNLIRRKSPDIIFLVETNQAWVDALSELTLSHPYTLLHPLNNTYGLAFYSKFPLQNAKINFLIEPNVPSIEAELILPSGATIQIYGIHPRPPRPQTGGSRDRDAELITIARYARESRHPVVVVGDLNDVAWSHTTRHFRRLSRLLDPRVGRGFFATFPAGYPWLRFPIDYAFNSDELRLLEIERMPDVGSDHLPLWIVFSHEPSGRGEQEAPHGP